MLESDSPEKPEPASGPQPSRSEEMKRDRAILLRALCRSSRRRYELKQRLLQRDIAAEIAEELLERFGEDRLIDDEQYGTRVVRTRHRERGLARPAIAQELRRRGISDEHGKRALEQLDSDLELARARELIARRIDSVRSLDRERALRRLMGYLLRRGYSSGQALSVIQPALDETGDGMI